MLRGATLTTIELLFKAIGGNIVASRDDSGQWYRSYGNENWQFTDGRTIILD